MDVTKKSQAWAVKKEVTEGVYLAPSVSSDFIQVLVDGGELSKSKEVIERNVYTASIGKIAPRTSTFSASGTLGVESKPNTVQGAAPEFDVVIHSAFGAKRQLAAEITTLTGNTTSVLKVTDASLVNVGDVILVKEAGKFHVSPISAIDLGSDEITLLVPAATAFSDGVKIAKFTTYTVAESGHPSFSVSRYLENAILQKAVGCKVNSMALENWSTGQLASLKFGFEGLNFDSILEAPPVAPSYDAQIPPIILSACVFMDGVKIAINDFSLTMENTLAFKTATCAENGRIGSRPTERSLSGSFNPFMASDSMANFNKFKNNTQFSIFLYSMLPSTVAGEFASVVGMYLPQCTMTEISEADQDGLMQDNITFTAHRADGTKNEIFMTFI